MTRCWLVLVLAACGSSTPPGIVAPPPATAPPDAVAAVAVAAPVKMIAGTPRDAIEEALGGAVAVLAVAGDGTAAISADDQGGMRLWPRLDGTREPCVVDLAIPHDLAITHHHDGFFVAMIDAAKALAFAVLDDHGRTLRHVTLAQDVGTLGIAMTDLGVLAWRDDQTIALYDLEGTQLGRLGTRPGERIDNVAANGKAAIAVLGQRADGIDSKIVRILTLQPALAWEDKILDAGGDASGPIAITRSGKRFAVVVDTFDARQHELRMVERGTSRLLASAMIDQAPELGFVDEDHLAVGLVSAVGWVTIKPAQPVKLVGPASGPALFAVGDGVVVDAATTELRLSRPDKVEFLGYQLEPPLVAALGPKHDLVVAAHHDIVQLDASLATSTGATPALPADGTIAELRWLGADDYAARTVDDAGQSTLSIVSAAGRDPVVVRKGLARVVQPILYEPTTHLLAASFGDQTVDRWVPDQRKLEHLASLPRASAFTDHRFIPIVPALAGGTELVEVSSGAASSVAWTDATTKKRSAAMPITAFITADAAGHVFAWTVDTATSQLVISVLAPGKVLGTLPHEGNVTLWPDPKGTRVLEVGRNLLALYKLDGTLVWKQNTLAASEA
ncbi:MAG: hypothetical protein ABI678_02815, partial [Kofleriaceae bacterium]